MEVFPNRQYLVKKMYIGDANKVTINIDPRFVRVGNTVDIYVRPVTGASWHFEHPFSADSKDSFESSDMTKSGTDANTLKCTLTDNVLSFTYKDSSEENVVNTSDVVLIFKEVY